MHPLLRQTRFLHSRKRLVDGEPDLFWRRANGEPMRQADWDDPDLDILVAEMRMASGSPEYVQREGALLVVLNRGNAVEITPPALSEGRWVRRFDTSQDNAIEVTDGMQVAADAVVVFSHET
jgi:glycogen operon protein